MKERPILFSGPMVRALHDGRKTQTRRIVKPSRTWPIGFIGGQGDQDDPSCYGFEDLNSGQWWTLAPSHFSDAQQIPCPYGAVGERLWVRESLALPSVQRNATGILPSALIVRMNSNCFRSGRLSLECP